ncbi:phage portal protein [Alkalibacillus almallahensis]|uniref:phage portal protein n=1 Tax=Alkalibacillus almallahensis TaxID=1379154 RepID=UPI0014234B4F|nr:phage portal protein [Alkalibacillus almallahensis]NIK12863.1 A118 family predicted phage portal protein [Alkalibacillus almallahensis]
MIKNFIQKVKEVMYKLGILKGVKEIAQHKQIDIDEQFYNQIDFWDALYKGYHADDFHNLKYHTIEKGEQTRRMLTLNIPKTVSQEMASLVFNEKVDINISDNEFSKVIEDIKKNNKFNKNFQDYLEYSFALGGVVIKPYVANDQIKLTFVDAKSFIPLSWNNRGVFEAVFPNQFKKGKYWYTHLEWHTWEGNLYVIQNTLHRSDNRAELGITVNLDEVFEGLEPEIRFSRFDHQAMFVHIKPNVANNFDMHSPLGISLYANALDTINQIDTMFDSFNREFRLGKKRIAVPSEMIKSVIDPNTGEMHRYFDANDESYEAFKFGDNSDSKIEDLTVELRVEEHISAINSMLNLLAMQTGFSSGTFSFDGESMKTATEVVSEQSKTFKSKKSHETVIESALQELIDIIAYLGRTFRLFTVPNQFETSVAFDDSVAEDKTAEITRLSQELQNKLIPKKRAIMRYYGLTEEEAQEWLNEINQENATATNESLDFFGGSGE